MIKNILIACAIAILIVPCVLYKEIKQLFKNNDKPTCFH